MQLAFTTLANRHSSIEAAGDLAIGGALDASRRATGQAGTLTNASAVIEALGTLSLNATRIDNRNEHFTTQLVTVGSEAIDEWSYGGRYRPDQVYLTWTSAPGVVYTPPASDGMGYMSSQGFFSNNKKNQVWLDSRLAAAVKGEAGMGAGTAAEANQLGRVWVGDGAKLVDNQVSCPGCLKSADGLRIYRPPTEKSAPAIWNPTGVQANFVQLGADGKVVSNSHLVVLP